MVKKTGIILAIFIIFIMVSSMLGFMSGGNEETVKYKGHKFTKVQNGWLGYINNQKILLGYDPNELENINFNFNPHDLKYAQKVYLSINPKENSIIPIFEKIRFLLDIRAVRSCNEDVPGCENFPIKTCDDATETVKVVLIKRSNKPEYYYQDNCLLIKGNLEEIKKVLNKIILELLI